MTEPDSPFTDQAAFTAYWSQRISTTSSDSPSSTGPWTLSTDSPSSTSTGLSCIVCKTPTEHAHLGVDICRACSAFYKRCKILDKRYVCRQGTGRCDLMRIKDNSSATCRKCRYIALNALLNGSAVVEAATARKKTTTTIPSPASSDIDLLAAVTTSSGIPTTPLSSILYGPRPSTNHRPQCVACNSASYSTHYGVPACRACSVFFRRCLKEDTASFVCKSKDEKSCRGEALKSCRKCRFEACQTLGMKKPGTRRSEDLDEETTGEAEASPSTSTGTGAQRVLMNEESFTLVMKLVDNYKTMVEARRVAELKKFPLEKETADDNPLRRLTMTMLSGILEVCSPAIFEFCAASFPEFLAFTESEKKILLREFIVHLLMFESAYYSVKTYGDDSTKRQATMTGYIDRDSFVVDGGSEDSVVQKEICDMLRRSFHDDEWNSIRSCCARVMPDDVEAAAMVGILLWMPRLEMVSDDVYERCSHIRESIHNGLHFYFRNVANRSDYATRMCNGVDLFMNIKEIVKKIWEDNRLFLMFNLYGKDSFLHELCS